MATTRDYEHVVQNYIEPKTTDIIFDTTPYLNRAKSKARKGDALWPAYVVPLEIARGLGGSYHDLEETSLQRKEILTAATYYPKQYYEPMTISHKDDLMYRSKQAKVSMAMVKAKNAKKNMAYNLSAGLISGAGGDDLYGLTTFIEDSESDSATDVGGLNGTAATTAGYDWQNYGKSVAATITDQVFLDGVAACSIGNDKPTIAWTDKYINSYILGTLLTPKERFVNESESYKTGERITDWHGTPLAVDAAFESSGTTGGRIYMVNENYMGIYIDSRDDMKRWKTQIPTNQFAYTTRWTISLTGWMSNRKVQGVLYGITLT